ncbi:GntR family transcriptional regulator [Ensifer sp. Root423]|uniref:GntR family transcriptional regulator n=1 Tax=Ensifer sp. Root423 TaxID=1736534 RepID=UPI000713802E|nr:GntR family transcriptional regulator [Ensifer sp. Root423]KQX26671.1 GntR family transcriptional regulator [Ensifer sp. Root423]
MVDEQENSTKTEAAYRILRTEILMARLQPGAPLRPDLLSKTYDVGRTPLREALSRLEAERLVVAISNRGFTVAPVSRKGLEDLTKARAVVEIPLLLEAMERGGSEWESAIVTAHYRLSRCKTIVEDSSDLAVDTWMERHEAFHAALLSAAQSSWLMHFRSTISDQLQRHYRFLAFAPVLRAAHGETAGYAEAMAALHKAQSIGPHTELMEAVLDRNAERARILMDEHFGYPLEVYAVEEGEAASSASRKPSTRPGTHKKSA